MKKASAKIRNKVKKKFARSISQLERIYGRQSSKPDRFGHHKKYK